MAGIELCKFTHGLGLYIRILPQALPSPCVDLHNSMSATRHFVAVPFTSFGNFELILNYLFLNEIFQNKDMDVNMKNIFIVLSNNNCRLLTTVQVFDIMFDNSAPPFS
jgi:hypothetical protein